MNLVVHETLPSAQVNLNGDSFTFAHRLSPFSATHLVVKGDVQVFNVTYTVPAGSGRKSVPSHALWTQVGGHFRHLEAHTTGVVWAIGEDGTCWYFMSDCVNSPKS